MNKLIFILPAVIPLLNGCNDSSRTTTPQPLPQITACPSDSGGDEKSYSPMKQKALLDGIKAGKSQQVFMDAFEQGDLIFGTHFTSDQGGGENITGLQNARYTRIPRADLKVSGEWGDPHRKVKRPTGPNAQSCASCHNEPTEDGAGSTSSNVHRDPKFSADAKLMIQRNTPHLFGAGALQKLAEEMTDDLYAIREQAGKEACDKKTSVYRTLDTKGVNFGEITMSCETGKPTLNTDSSHVVGIDPDWMVRPYEWKKSVTFLRDFMRHAGNNEIGMQAVELAGQDVDEDRDGVANELSVGDITAFTVYMAAQPRPTTKVELDDLGLLTNEQHLALDREKIKQGERLFQQIGCTSCHLPEMTLNNSVFKEPSAQKYEANPGNFVAYHDLKEDFLKEDNVQVDLEKENVLLNYPVQFDLAHDQPQNQLCKGKEKINLGAFESKNGKTIVRLYSDLKRHWMGDDLAEPVDELEKNEEYSGGSHMSLNSYDPINAVIDYKSYDNNPNHAKATFGTEELWGVACTGPWMHDGRATTISQAIALHGGERESVESSNKFKQLPEQDKKALFAFLDNQVLYLNTKKSGEKPDELSDMCKIEL